MKLDGPYLAPPDCLHAVLLFPLLLPPLLLLQSRLLEVLRRLRAGLFVSLPVRLLALLVAIDDGVTAGALQMNGRRRAGGTDIAVD